MLSLRFIDFDDFTHIHYKLFLSDAEIINKNEQHVEQEMKSGYDHLISVLNDFKSTMEHDTPMLTSKVDSLNLNLKGIKQEILDVITTHLNSNSDFLQDDETSVLSAKVDSLNSNFDEIKHQMSDIINFNSNFLQDDAKNQTKMGLDELTDIDKKMWNTGILY